MILLCRVEDLTRTGAKTLELGEGQDILDVLVVKTGEDICAYIDSCPHQFIPLETFPDHVFTQDRKFLICSGHGALFAPATGDCVDGPCAGEALDRLTISERDGAVYLDDDRTPAEIARAKRPKRNW